MKLDAKKLGEMSDAALTALNLKMTQERDDIKAEQAKLKVELDRRAVAATAKARAKSMSKDEREAMAKELGA